MIISVTSKRGGTGRTSVAIILALNLAKHHGKSVCLVDLKQSNDIIKLLKLKTSATIDNLITPLGFGGEFTKVEDNLCKYDAIDILPGTCIQLPTYLYKSSNYVLALLQYLAQTFDFVVLDIDDAMLYEDLKSKQLGMYPLHVLDQNMLVVAEYQEDMRTGGLEGLILVNKVNDKVFPGRSEYSKNFDTKSLYFLEDSLAVRNTLNRVDRRKGINFTAIVKTGFYKEIDRIGTRLIEVAPRFERVEHTYVDKNSLFYEPPKTKQVVNKKPAKKSFLARLGIRR